MGPKTTAAVGFLVLCTSIAATGYGLTMYCETTKALVKIACMPLVVGGPLTGLVGYVMMKDPHCFSPAKRVRDGEKQKQQVRVPRKSIRPSERSINPTN